MTICHFDTLTHSSSDEWVVLLHGLFGNLDNLKGLAHHLSTDMNVLLMDLPAHGRSPGMETFDFALYAHMIADTLTHLKLDNVHLVGHSLGGKMAMTIALLSLYPIQSLVVADIAPVPYPPRHDAVFNALNAIDLDQIDSRKSVKASFDQTLSDEGTRQFLLKGLTRTDTGWQWQFNLPLLQAEYAKIIDWPFQSSSQRTYHSAVPTLFIKGSDSEYITAAMQPAITASFSRAKAHIIEGTGHWLHAQKPAVFNRTVSRFLHSV